MPSGKVLDDADVRQLAQRHGVSEAAIEAVAQSMAGSVGKSAQFSHPELGGMGQWLAGGMLMIGDMFDNGLKSKVDRICRDVAQAIAARDATRGADAAGGDTVQSKRRSAGWWPEDFGIPSSSGAQNDMRYAFFPASRRLVIDEAGTVSVYDTGDHVLTGFSQQQSGARTLAFSSPTGAVALSALKKLAH